MKILPVPRCVKCGHVTCDLSSAHAQQSLWPWRQITQALASQRAVESLASNSAVSEVENDQLQITPLCLVWHYVALAQSFKPLKDWFIK